MPLTPKHDIYYPNAESQFTPLESHFAALATSVDDALIVQATETQTSVGNVQAVAEAAAVEASTARTEVVVAQAAADAAAVEAGVAKQDALVASNRIDTLSGEVDHAAQSAQDAWNLALEATANATQRVNLVPNPSYEDGINLVSSGTGVAQLTSVTTANARSSGTRALSVRVEGASASNAWVSQSLVGSVEGTWLGVSLVARRSTGPTHARLYVNWAGAGTEFVGDMWALPTGANSLNPRQRFAVQVPAGATGASVWLRLYGSAGGAAPLDGVTHTDAWMAAWADSETAALTAVDTYFDGDSPDRYDAAGIMYQTHWSGVPNESSSVETAYTSAMLEIMAQANAATQAALSASGEAGNALTAAGNALAAAMQAENAAMSKINTYYSATAPSPQAVGELWIDIGSDPSRLRRWNGSAWVDVSNAVLQQALEAAGDAQAIADGKIRTFAQINPPGGMVAGDVGDLWIDTDDGNRLYRWSGSAWVPMQDAGIQSAIAAAGNALSAAVQAGNVASSKINTFYASTSPTAAAVGDLWIDIGSNPKQLRRWNGSTWVNVTDAVLQKALEAAGDAQATADGKVRTFAQNNPPTGMKSGDVGDLWIDTNDGNKLYRWSGSAWVILQDTAIPAAAAAAANAASAAASAAGIANGKADVLIQSTTPTTNMRKATTLWIDTTNGNNTPKRWSGSAWVAVTDKAVVDAANAAAAANALATQALNTAGGKNKVFRSVSAPGSTQGTAVGDVWWRFAESTMQGPIIGQWTWTGSQWRPATIDSAIIANLTVDKLVVTGGAKFPLAVIDTLVGDDAFFKRVMAEQIIVTSENIIPGVDTILKSTAGWSGFGRNTNDPSWWLQGTKNVSTDVPFMVTAGVEYSFEVEVRASVSGTSFYIQAVAKSDQVFPASTSYIMSDQRLTGTSTTWNTFAATWTAPASGEIVLRFWANHTNGTSNPTGYQWFRNPTMRPRIGAIQLKNGVVTAPKMAAGALDAFQITAPNIRSTATANRGIKWSGNQFVAYNNSGVEMIRLEGNTGAITGVTITGGRLQTATTGTRILISTSSGGTNPGMWMYGPTGSARIQLGFAGTDPMLSFGTAAGVERVRLSAEGTMWMWAPNGQESFRLYTSNDATFGRVWLQGPNYGGNRAAIMMGRQTVDGTISSTVRLNSGSATDQAFLQLAAGGSWFLGSGTRGRIDMNNATGELTLYPRSNLLSFYNLPTTSSTGTPITMIVSGTGRPSIYRNTSVRADKTHIEDLEVDPLEVLDLQPRTFYDRGAWERYADALTVEYDREHGQEPDPEIAVHEGTQYPDRLVGFIAEEVEDLFPELVSYDEQGNLSGVQYDRVSGHLLLAVRALKSEIDNLKENING